MQATQFDQPTLSVPTRQSAISLLALISGALSAASLLPTALVLVFWAKGLHLTSPAATPYSAVFVLGTAFAAAGSVLALGAFRPTRTGIAALVISTLVLAASVSGWFYYAANLHK